MEVDWAKEILKQVPALAVLAWIVLHGVKAWGVAQNRQNEHDRTTQETFHRSLAARDAILQQLHKDIRQDARETRSTLSDVKSALVDVGRGNVALLEAIRKINGVGQ